MTLAGTLARTAFRVGGSIAPRLAGKAAYLAFCLPPRQTRSDAGQDRLTEKLGPLLAEAEAHRITTPDAEVQAYLWRTATSPARGRVLLIHGWTSEALVMGLFVKPFRDAGYDVVAFDLPAHGRSRGRLLNMPIGARATQAVADALGPITAIVSHSFGGAVAALAVEGGTPLDRRLAVDRLVLIAAPHSIAKAARDFGDGLAFREPLQRQLAGEITRAAGRDVDGINVGDFLRTAGRPVLVVHDLDDDRVPYAEAEALVAAAGPIATAMTTRGLGHARIVVMPNVVRAAVRFVARAEATP